ncbi:MAG: FHA domain-containing protein [Fimbriimonadaceae bacterium]|nr:FHA domain-containing protein [Fimbriimonadaceae bacterium]
MSDANRTQMLNADPNRTQLGMAPRVGPDPMDPNKTVMGVGPSINVTQTIKPVQCPVCKTFNPAGLFFCNECGLIFDRALPDDAFGAPAVQLPMLVEKGGREFPIRPGTSSIGREGDIALADSRVSRRHAQIRSADGSLTLEDLGSTNGTKVNGTALTAGIPQAVKGGDTISFGGLEVQVQLPGTASANVTQAFANHRTAAMSAAPQVEVAPAKLVGDSGEYPLRAGANTFGRKAENDITISDPYVSGKHGVIELAEDGIYVTDIGSSNGTVLSGAKMVANMRTRIQPDDVIRLGSLEFRVIRAGD